MIEKKKAEEVFKNYVEPYDMTNGKIALKVVHTYHTAQVAEEIAKSLKLEKEDIELAWLVGLLHDIGRFEQLRIYDTFNDSKSIDHGDFAVKLLFEDELIRKFTGEEKYYPIIYKAIKNHNKYKIEDGLNERELLHAKIIRDADKTDIFRVHVEEIEEHKNVLYHPEELRKQIVSPIIMKNFLEHRLSKRKDVKQDIDQFIIFLSFLYDYNFEKGLEIIKENRYVERALTILDGCEETRDQAKLIENTILSYIKTKIS